MSRDEEEGLLVEQFRVMSDKDRAWILSLTTRCAHHEHESSEETIILSKESSPREQSSCVNGRV
jgi:hypothetical protein